MRPTNSSYSEIVRALRACGGGKSTCEKCPFYDAKDADECRFTAIREAADLVESLQGQLLQKERRLKALERDLKELRAWPVEMVMPGSKVTICEAMERIESLKHHCEAMATPGADEMWARDVVALRAAHFALELLADRYDGVDSVIGKDVRSKEGEDEGNNN